MSMADRSVREYEQAASQTRQRLASTLDELADNLTPGRVLDEVMSYAKSGGGNFLRGLGNAAAENPLPTLMIGLGAAMFLSGKGRMEDVVGMFRSANGGGADSGRSRMSGVSTGPRDYGAPVHGGSAPGAYNGRGTIGDAAHSAASGLRHSAEAVGSTIAGAAGSVRDAVSGAAGTVRDTAMETAEGIREGLGSAAGQAGSMLRSGSETLGSAAGGAMAQMGDTAARAGRLASDAASQAMSGAEALGNTVAGYAEGLSEQAAAAGSEARRVAADWSAEAAKLVRDQPLLVAAGGLVIGAAIAAMLPRSRLEDQLLGETADAIKGTVGEVASEQFDKAKAAAGSVAEAVQSAAAKEGLSTAVAADVLKDIGDKVSSVVKAGGSAAKAAALPESTDKGAREAKPDPAYAAGSSGSVDDSPKPRTPTSRS